MNASKIHLAAIGALHGADVEFMAVNEVNAPPTVLEFLEQTSVTGRDVVGRTLIYLLQKLYGGNEQRLRDGLSRLGGLCRHFIELYGDGSVNILHAPARINILGEHIDYVSYLPTASLTFGSREHDMLMLYRPTESARVRGASTGADCSTFDFHVFDQVSVATTADIDRAWTNYLSQQPPLSPHWSNYVKGAVSFAGIKYGVNIQHGFDFLVDSGIPSGGGASSSSALVVLASAAIRLCNDVGYSPEDLAADAAKAEWYVGTRGGAMDHTTICLAREGRVVLISYSNDSTRSFDLPVKGFRWITFFSHAADKSREVMNEYNERAAVSRVIIPRLVEAWDTEAPDRYQKWLKALGSFTGDSSLAVDTLESLLSYLPETLTLSAMQCDYPKIFSEYKRMFPALVNGREDRPIVLRARALHHLGEIRRVVLATKVLERIANGRPAENDLQMRTLGKLLDESHASLRDLYEVSTPELEALISIVRTHPQVYGARLMGGGFGGNVLVLASADVVSSLIERVQREYYSPRNRNGINEKAIMISTPGAGLRSVELESEWRRALKQYNSRPEHAADHRETVEAVLDHLDVGHDLDQLWPVIVAAGKGSRARDTGIKLPKPAAPVAGIPSIRHVLNNIRSAVGTTRPAIVIVSSETESEIRALLSSEDITYVLQPEALGTGDAVLCAEQAMSGFEGRALVVWSTQPVIRPETIRRTFSLAMLFGNYEMVFPTALTELPYAPLLRDKNGSVQGARETHLEDLQPPSFGETNIGLFILRTQTMFATLRELKSRHWNHVKQRYDRPKGELAFPNELINALSGKDKGVFASPIAQAAEAQGIKELADIERCEKIIAAGRNTITA